MNAIGHYEPQKPTLILYKAEELLQFHWHLLKTLWASSKYAIYFFKLHDDVDLASPLPQTQLHQRSTTKQPENTQMEVVPTKRLQLVPHKYN